MDLGAPVGVARGWFAVSNANALDGATDGPSGHIRKHAAQMYQISCAAMPKELGGDDTEPHIGRQQLENGATASLSANQQIAPSDNLASAR